MKKIVVFLLIITSILSCNQQVKIDTKNIKIEGVTLDHNKKWQANAATTNGINKMIIMMNNFSESKDVKAYHQLKTDLETQFTDIFTKCTMKGEAHNQLHNYLKPMIDYFEGLASEDIKVCHNNYKQLHIHLLGYANYFE